MNPLIQTSLSLLVVLGVIGACAYAIRRLQLKLPGNQHLITVKSAISLGSKERLVLVEVGGQWLLIGITSSAIQHIYTLPHPPDVPDVSTTGNPSWLKTYLQQKNP